MSNSELLQNQDFMREQYGHLPQDEWPTSGEVVDVRGALATNNPQVESIGRQITRKRIATQNWVEANYPGKTAVYLTRPFAWKGVSADVQDVMAQWMVDIIMNVYGEGYPLPNRDHDFNVRGLRNGSLLAYCGLIAPKDLGNGSIFKDPQLIHHPDLIPVASSAIVMGEDGFAELGRTARKTDIPGFDGGPIVLERMYDWMRNRHGLLEGVHTMTSVVRSAEAHDHSPSSGPVQNLTVGKLGMRINLTAPLYNVNGIEPFLGVVKTRNPERWAKINENRKIFTVPGDHTDYLAELWQHQVGHAPNIQLVSEPNSLSPHRDALYDFYGPNIYTEVRVVDPNKRDKLTTDQKNSMQGMDQILPQVEKDAPLVVVKVEAESPQSAVTQQYLIDQGYVICGVQAAIEEDYLADCNGSGRLIQSHRSPAYIFLTKLGDLARHGEASIAPAYFPTPEDSKGVDIHGKKLREFLYATDRKIRETIR